MFDARHPRKNTRKFCAKDRPVYLSRRSVFRIDRLIWTY